eukprot:jgi/Psemu1/7277/gm1.7277_g
MAITIGIKSKSTSETTDIPNNNVDSAADSNISQILLSDDDRKPSARKNSPPANISVKKKTLNIGSALFSHQKNNTDFRSSSSNDDDIEIPPSDKAPSTNKAPKKKALPNSCREAMKALLMKKSPYTRAIKTIFLVKFKGLTLSDLHRNKHSSALIKLQIKAINSGPTVSQRRRNWNTKFMVPILLSIHFRYKAYKEELAVFRASLRTSSRNNHSTSASSFQTQTIKYLDQILEKDFDFATDQNIEQMEAVAAKAREMDKKKAKSVTSSKAIDYQIRSTNKLHFALQAKIKNQTTAPTNPADSNPSVPPSQQEDDSIDSDSFDDLEMDSDSNSNPDYKDTPEYQSGNWLHILMKVSRGGIDSFLSMESTENASLTGLSVHFQECTINHLILKKSIQ